MNAKVKIKKDLYLKKILEIAKLKFNKNLFYIPNFFI